MKEKGRYILEAVVVRSWDALPQTHVTELFWKVQDRWG